MAKNDVMTFKIDTVAKKRLMAMAETERRSASDFIRLLLEREWKRRVEAHPTQGEVAAAGGEWIKGE